MGAMQAPNYTPQTDFSDDELNNAGGRSTVRTDRLDAELSDVSKSINAINSNLQLIQRDDGQLRDGIVQPYNLSAATRAFVLATKWNARGLWSTAQTYAVNDLVDYLGAAYVCAVAHTSTSFPTDYTAGKWQVFTTAESAAVVSFAPTGQITSTNVQAAIAEVSTQAGAASNPLVASLFGGL